MLVFLGTDICHQTPQRRHLDFLISAMAYCLFNVVAAAAAIVVFAVIVDVLCCCFL